MAALLVALFVIVVVWALYLIPSKSRNSSTLTFWGRQSKVSSHQPVTQPVSGVKVVPIAKARSQPLSSVPIAVIQRGSTAPARRRRVRTVLVAMAVITAASGLYAGSLNWWLAHVVVDGLLIIYSGLAMLVRGGSAGSYSTVSLAERQVLRRVSGD